MTTYQRFFRSAVTLSIVLSLAITGFGFPSKRSRPGKRRPVRIVLDKTEVQLGPNQTAEVKAKVLGQYGNEISRAKIEWKPTPEAQGMFVMKSIDEAGKNVLITRKAGSVVTGAATIRAQSGSASADLNLILQSPVAGEVIFPDGNTIDLPVGSKKVVRAYALDSQGNRIRDAEINWRLADPNLEVFVYPGRVINSHDVNSVELLWRPGKAEIETPGEVQVIATAGSSLAVLTVKYKSASTPNYKITFDDKDKKELKIAPGDSDAIKVTVRGDDERIVDVKPSAEIADENARKFIRVMVGSDKKTITIFGIYGDDAKSTPTFIPTTLVVRAAGAVITIPIVYQRDAAVVDWDILPPKIVGDNYGHTIMKDYYCIEVTIQNNSGADLALAGLRFDNGGVRRPNTSYTTVHGSLDRRKITHPRALTLAIIDGMGSLMTGFNPFFHNVNHAKNFSQFIDILSNPLAKGLEKAWMDPYPGELARFEQDVLRDDKIIPNAGIFKTKIFVPKRALFTNEEKKKREDLTEVRKALGILWVLGYKFQKGPVQSIATAP